MYLPALIRAVQQSVPDSVRLLLQHKASPDERSVAPTAAADSSLRSSALSLAIHHCAANLGDERLRAFSIVRLLVEANATFASDEEQQRALEAAARKDDLELFRLLVERPDSQRCALQVRA